MRMSCRFKSVSRAVHEEHERERHEEEDRNKYPRTEGSSCATSLTVWRKSLVINCEGFTVIDSYGNLVYRVDNYVGRPDEVILMDASGHSVLTMLRRRKLGLVDRWFVYEGEVGTQQRTRRSNDSRCKLSSKSPICCVKKHVNILQSNPKVQAYVYRGGGASSHSSGKRHAAFTIEGSYAHRTCKVMDEWKRVVAEIRRKEAKSKDVSFGIEIFQLIVQPGFDPAFAMALVLLLDQMFS